MILFEHDGVTPYTGDLRTPSEIRNAKKAWDTEQNLMPLLEFLRNQTEKTWERQIARANMQKAEHPESFAQ